MTKGITAILALAVAWVIAATITPPIEAGVPPAAQVQAAADPAVRYCLSADAAPYRQALAEGFAMWADTGLRFVEASGGDCIAVTTVYDPNAGYIGWASVGPYWLTINTYYEPTALGMAHEAGHLLGLYHYAHDGIMNDSGRYTAPSVDDIAAVRRMWRLE